MSEQNEERAGTVLRRGAGGVSRPRLLDLFCGAGGAAMGYHRAGFDVVGVDIEPQPRYPFEFHQADAMTFPLNKFDAIHASTPCQAHTTMSNRWRGKGGRADDHESLVAATRRRLLWAGKPYVIENVPGARAHLRNPIVLHGGMFGLGVARPRLFESNVVLLGTVAPAAVSPVGVFGRAHDGRRLFTRADGSIQRAAATLQEARAAMGIDWMEWRELAESIPPAYTEYIGRQLLPVVAALSERSTQAMGRCVAAEGAER
jgi:DNA (cytosine-5)-methyltransferase 1